MPPEEYDYLFDGKLIVERTTDQNQMRLNCLYSPFKYLIACAKRTADGGCYILMMDNDFTRKAGMPPEIVLRHEMGHCNGWPPDHRGGKPYAGKP